MGCAREPVSCLRAPLTPGPAGSWGAAGAQGSGDSGVGGEVVRWDVPGAGADCRKTQ